MSGGSLVEEAARGSKSVSQISVESDSVDERECGAAKFFQNAAIQDGAAAEAWVGDEPLYAFQAEASPRAADFEAHAERRHFDPRQRDSLLNGHAVGIRGLGGHCGVRCSIDGGNYRHPVAAMMKRGCSLRNRINGVRTRMRVHLGGEAGAAARQDAES